ncbi:MAG TPA: hypothetical protein VL133_08940 [Devosia sp.]|nr:hypothetical protein [Devosia sp.]
MSGPNAGVAVQPSVATALRAGGTAVAPASPQTLVAAVPQAAAIVALPEPAQVPEASAVLPGLGEMSAFIDAHSDQACLAAVAETDTSGIAMMTGYGTVATLDGFAAEARAQFGAALSIDARVISPGQCWLLDMLGAWRRYWDPEFDIVLTNEQVPSGGTVRATITNVGGTWLYVLLVDDEGKVSDLADYLIARDDVVSLAAPVTATGTGEYRLQLLVAITTETSLVSIDQHRGEAAQSFFAALQQELKTRQIRPQLSVTAFKVY